MNREEAIEIARGLIHGEMPTEKYNAIEEWVVDALMGGIIIPSSTLGSSRPQEHYREEFSI